jgi:hypothetical protein
MSRRTNLIPAFVACAGLAGGTEAFAAAPPRAPAVAPPLLSTTPTPPIGAVSEPTQMSGLPLQVGDLPPGTVAVRVIRQSFANNVASHPVELHHGASGRALESTTNSAGRALFDGLAVGELISVSAVVDGERLESQRFELPAQGGVRLVLVAGVGAGVAGPASQTSMHVSQPLAASTPDPTVAGSGAPLYLVPFAVLVLSGAGIWWSRTRPLRDPSSGPAGGSPDRDALFEALISLERERAAGSLESAVYTERHDELISLLMKFDQTTSPP